MGEAIVEFQYTAQEEDELTLKVGDVITNVTKTSEGWCEGTLNGRRGMFPDNFVKMQEPKKEATMPAKRQNAAAVQEIRTKLNSVILPGGIPPAFTKKPVKRAKVTFAYASQQEDELTLEVGNVVEILKQEDSDWWEGSLNGKVGMFPSNFVEIIDGEKQGTDEVSEIRGRKVEGVGFGNIFAGGQIVLRSKGEKKDPTDTSKDVKPPQVKSKPVVPTPGALPVVTQKGTTKPVLRARVTFPYTAANEDELDLADGEIVTVLDQNLEDDGWWKGELNGKVGVFPDNFVMLLPVESEKPPKPAMPPPPAAASLAGTKSAGSALPIDTQKAKFVRKDESKATSPPAVRSDVVKPPEVNQSHETDDSKAKKNKEFVQTGSLDSIKPSESAFRVRPPVQRHPASGPAPSREAPTPDERPASVAKVQPQVPLKDDHSLTSQKVHRDSSEHSSMVYATHEQYVELQREVVQLREALEQTRKSQDKRINDLVAEIDEEKKVRLNLQVELERLKKMIAS